MHVLMGVVCVAEALQDAIEMEALTAGKDNDDDEDDEDEDDDDDDDENDGSKPELMGVLIRTPDAKTSGEDGDNDDGIVFVGVDALRDAFEDAMSEIQDEQELGSADESDVDDTEVEWEPPKSKADGLATRVSTGLSVIEFVVMLYVLAMDKVPAELLSEPPARAVFDAFLLRAATSQFWISFGIYCFLFFLLPILIGLIFGKQGTPESVLGYALSRYALLFITHTRYFLRLTLLYGPLCHGCSAAIAYMLPFNLADFAGQQRILNTTAVVSIVLAFWEKQSAYADF